MTKLRANSALNSHDTPAIRGALQRTCACGQHTGAGGECEACRKRRLSTLQRAAISAPPVGQTRQIGSATSALMESRFEHNFSQIPSYRNAAGTLQAKLAINNPGDEYEQEADRVADQVMAAPAQAIVSSTAPHIQRFTGQPSGQIDTAPTSVDRVLAGSGHPLEPGLRQHMEQRFGYDFSHVRVHTGGAAEQSANDVNARAYTVQHNVVFGAGQFAPETREGQRLIAHELTHVVQQAGANAFHTDQSDEKPRHGTSIHVQSSQVIARQPDAAADTAAPQPANKTDTAPQNDTRQYQAQANGPQIPACESQPTDQWITDPQNPKKQVFGLTTLTGAGGTEPKFLVGPAPGGGQGVVVLRTSASIPPIKSTFLKPGLYIDKTAMRFRSQADSALSTPPGGYFYAWEVTDAGSKRIQAGEQEHCDDVRFAFYISLYRFAEIVNDMAAKGTVYPSQADATAALRRQIAIDPVYVAAYFKCVGDWMQRERDTKGWHTPKPPRVDRIGYDSKSAEQVAIGTLTGNTLPEVGKHSSWELFQNGAAQACAYLTTLNLSTSPASNSQQGGKKQLQRKARDSASDSSVPPIVHDVLRSPGQPLDAATRAFIEPRFGRDFSHVRVHAGARAAQSARAVNALAYTVGHNVVFGDGQYAPHSSAGQRLLAHELTHVLQQPEIPPGAIAIDDPNASHEQEADSIAERVVARSRQSLPPTLTAAGPIAIQPRPSSAGTLTRAPDDLTNRARYPTSTERTDIQEVLNPQQHQAASQGTQVPQVTDPTGFQNDMTARLNQYISAVLPSSQARQSSTVALGAPEIQGLGDVAQQEVQRFYGTHLRAAIHSPVEQQRRAGYQLRQHLHLVPTTQSAQTDDAAHSWVASRMLSRGADLLETYHVLAGRGARDEALFQTVRNHIFLQRTADLRTIILFHPGYEEHGEAYIQARIAPEYSGQAQQDTQRRGRWRALGTTIHEMLHAVAHEDFSSGVAGLEEAGIAVEGFAEYFTAPVYENLTNRASSEDALRTSIEGVSQPFQQPPDREPGSYSRYVDGVVRIRDILGGNEDSLKVAFFLGRLEYLGLRGWNEAEAARQRFPGNMLGAAALLTQDSQGFFRIDYSRVMFGRSGNFQIQLGGTINYLTEGQRLGLGANAALQYSWPDVYIRGGLGVAGSASVTQPFSNSVRLDLLPGVEAGVRIGVARVGAGATLLIPVAGGPVSERVIRVGGGLGLSVAF